jgi:hypothetical protein
MQLETDKKHVNLLVDIDQDDKGKLEKAMQSVEALEKACVVMTTSLQIPRLMLAVAGIWRCSTRNPVAARGEYSAPLLYWRSGGY